MQLPDRFEPHTDADAVEFRVQGLGPKRRENPWPGLFGWVGAGLFTASPSVLFLLGPEGAANTAWVLLFGLALTSAALAVGVVRIGASPGFRSAVTRGFRVSHRGVALDGELYGWDALTGMSLDESSSEIVLQLESGEVRVSAELHDGPERAALGSFVYDAWRRFGQSKGEAVQVQRAAARLREKVK